MKLDINIRPTEMRIELQPYTEQRAALTMQTVDSKHGQQHEVIYLFPENRHSSQLYATPNMELVIEWRPRRPLPTEKKI